MAETVEMMIEAEDGTMMTEAAIRDTTKMIEGIEIQGHAGMRRVAQIDQGMETGAIVIVIVIVSATVAGRRIDIDTVMKHVDSMLLLSLYQSLKHVPSELNRTKNRQTKPSGLQAKTRPDPP